MATDIGEDRDIFDSGNAADDVLDTRTDNQTLTEPRSAEDTAVSDAIRQLNRGAPDILPPAPTQRQPAPATGGQPGAEPGGEEDRSTAGLLRALLDERERRQGLEQKLGRYTQQEQDATRAADANRTPLSQRLFEDPDAVINELRQEITAPLTDRLEQMRVQHDLALASVRHTDTFADAWAAWYGKVGTGQDPDTYFKIMKAPSPGEALVQWFKAEQRNSTVGEDLEAYNARIIREAFESRGIPVPPELAGAGGQPQQTQERQPATGRDPATGRFAPAQPQAQRYPSATSRMGQSGGGLADHDEDASDAAIFDSGKPERGKAR